MMRSLYSGISGLKNHQIKMDVLGNNIANVNTTGFKKSRVTFATMLSQTLRGESPSNEGATPPYGGTNPMQLGLGTKLGSIDKIMNQGSAQTTGSSTDLMIQGKGFFVLDDIGNEVYSRAGGFAVSSEGYLVDPGSGAFVQGYKFTDDADTPKWDTKDAPDAAVYERILLGQGTEHPSDAEVELQSFTIDQKGVITGVYVDKTTKENKTYKIAQIAIASFNNDNGLFSLDGNFYRDTKSSGEAMIAGAGEGSRGTLIPNAVEMSNVDLSEEFTDMIVTQRGFQANSRIITVSDSLLQELIDLKRN